jgi:CHAT domain-containing protein
MEGFYKEWLAKHDEPITKAEALQRGQLAVMRMSAQDALTNIAQIKTKIAGQDTQRRQSILDWDEARVRAHAGDFAKAVELGTQVLDQMKKMNVETRQLENDVDRWELTAQFSTATDYSRRIYARPFYWAPFVLVGDWK